MGAKKDPPPVTPFLRKDAHGCKTGSPSCHAISQKRRTWVQERIPLLSRHFSEKTHMGAKKDPPPVTPSKLHFSEKKDADAKKNYTMSMGVHRKENLFL